MGLLFFKLKCVNFHSKCLHLFPQKMKLRRKCVIYSGNTKFKLQNFALFSENITPQGKKLWPLVAININSSSLKWLFAILHKFLGIFLKLLVLLQMLIRISLIGSKSRWLCCGSQHLLPTRCFQSSSNFLKQLLELLMTVRNVLPTTTLVVSTAQTTCLSLEVVLGAAPQTAD